MITILTPAVTDDLTTLAKVKLELGVAADDTANDTHLQDLIKRASGAITRWCGRTTFGREVVRQTEFHVSCRSRIILDRDLEPEVSAVTVDGTALTVADHVALDGAFLLRLSGGLPIAWSGSKIVVDYEAGYDLLGGLPQEVEQACVQLVSAWYAGRGRDPLLRSQSVDGVGSDSWLDPREGMAAMPPQAAELLMPWRRWRV